VRAILILVLALALGGCADTLAQKQAAEAKRQADLRAEVEACKQQFPTAPRKNNVALSRCINDVNGRFWTDQVNHDLLDLYAAKRIAIATQMDEGKISQEDGQVLIEQARSDAITQIQQRVNANQSVAAQQQAARAATAAAIGASSPVTCTRFGNTVNCF
jgi:hypothetical protein